MQEMRRFFGEIVLCFFRGRGEYIKLRARIVAKLREESCDIYMFFWCLIE